MENKAMTSVLDRLAGVLQQCGSMHQVYLDSIQEKEFTGVERPDEPINRFRINEGKLPAFLQIMGIRSMTVDDAGNMEALLAAAAVEAMQIVGPPGNLLRSRPLVNHLRTIFQHTTTLAFADWALFASASDSWDALLKEVIRPTGKKDIEYIFYLGDISATPVFMVDEMLDIVGEYARYGQITFILDQQEMVRLWQGLNGVHRTMGDTWPFDYEEKYRALFNAMNVQRLLVYAANGVSLYSREQRFNLSRRVMASEIENSARARNDFINGYSMGLTLGLDLELSIALGIVFYGATGEYNRTPDLEMLLQYIKTWKELQDPVA